MTFILINVSKRKCSHLDHPRYALSLSMILFLRLRIRLNEMTAKVSSRNSELVIFLICTFTSWGFVRNDELKLICPDKSSISRAYSYLILLSRLTFTSVPLYLIENGRHHRFDLTFVKQFLWSTIQLTKQKTFSVKWDIDDYSWWKMISVYHKRGERNSERQNQLEGWPSYVKLLEEIFWWTSSSILLFATNQLFSLISESFFDPLKSKMFNSSIRACLIILCKSMSRTF